ncbi:AI-2E family transporter [Mediterraneibacter agrestimuris]|uniref:AI-2E family transporter n=1 Tax=Mediterraneibacter agrestimuris TaxID=2941333 RepID=UPI00203E6B63|nr:AI-2E family transporter [Mediterraneibacter agrestimuris]
MNFNKENIRHIRELIVFTIVLLIALWNYTIVLDMIGFVGNILFPFAVGGAIAFVLNVPMSFAERNIFKNKSTLKNKKLQRMARPLSLTLTIAFVLGIVGIVMFVVVPQLGHTFASLGRNISRFIPKAIAWLEMQFEDNKEILALIGDMNMSWDKMLDGIIGFFKNGVGNVFDSTISVATSIVGSVTTSFIAFVFACYILLQKEKLHVQIKKVLFAYLPEKRVVSILDICSLTYKTFSNFLTGQCVEALILGSMFFVVMGIIRLPYALLVGVLIAFTALIPIFGAFIGCAVGAFLILMVDPWKAVVFVILFLVLQQIEGNLIYPKVVGNSVGLPSIWVLAAVSIGGSLMGVVGMLIFIPLVSVVYTIFRGDVYRRLEKKQISVE